MPAPSPLGPGWPLGVLVVPPAPPTPMTPGEAKPFAPVPPAICAAAGVADISEAARIAVSQAARLARASSILQITNSTAQLLPPRNRRPGQMPEDFDFIPQPCRPLQPALPCHPPPHPPDSFSPVLM